MPEDSKPARPTRQQAEEAVRTERRRREALLGYSAPYAAPYASSAPHPAGAALSEIEGVPAEVYEAECAEVLRQLNHLRRQSRRPRTRRFARGD